MNWIIAILLILFSYQQSTGMTATDMITLIGANGKEISISRAQALQIGQVKDILSRGFNEASQNKIEFKDLSNESLNTLKNFIDKNEIQDAILALRIANQLDYLDLEKAATDKILDQLAKKQITLEALKSKLAGTTILNDMARSYFLENGAPAAGLESITHFTFKDIQGKKHADFFRHRTSGNFGKTFDFSNLNLTSLEGLNTIPNLLQVVTLSLYGNKLGTIDSSTIPALANLKTLTLNNSNISSIAPGAFKNYPQLVYLQLSDNPLKTLAANTFEGLPNLTDLFLSKTSLQNLADDIFQQTPALQRIMLNNNQLSKINPAVFRQLPQLKTVNLMGNQLSQENKKELQNAYPLVKFIF